MTLETIGVTVPLSIYGHVRYATLHRQATMWKIVLVDGTTFRFTDHDRDIPLKNDGSDTYLSLGFATASVRRKQSGLRQQSLEIVGLVQPGVITAPGLLAGSYRNAAVTERLVDWRYPFAGDIQQNSYWIDSARFDEQKWTAQLSGVSRWLAQTRGPLWSKTCRYSLGDPATCTVDLAAHSATTSTTVTTVTDRVDFAATGLTEVDGMYDFGVIEWTSGLNAGLFQDVKIYLQTGGLVTLQLPARFDVQAGDAFTIYPGCNKTVAECILKYNNVLFFGGEPDIVGTDAIIAEKGEFI